MEGGGNSASKMLSLHVADQGWVPDITYDPFSTTRNYPWAQIINNIWAPHGVGPNKTKQKAKQINIKYNELVNYICYGKVLN